MASSSSSSVPRKYQVSLSLSGEDTRNNFTSHVDAALKLDAALKRKGIDTVVDHQLIRGEENSQAQSTAIEKSKISIIVLSKNYASSSWRLDELCKILECKKTMGQKVLPIFYHVDPSDVRHIRGSFEEAFAKHQQRFKDETDKVEKWRAALKEVADLPGFHLSRHSYDRPKSEVVEEIAQHISRNLMCNSVINTKGLVGIDSRVKEIELLVTEPVYNLSLKQKFRQSITSWQKGARLGSGAFGIVYEGFTDDGFLFAVKEASLQAQEGQDKKRISQFEQEISLLSQFEHENIVQYFGTDKDDAKLYIFLELVPNGSLETLYKKYELRDSQVSLYTRQILSGLKYLHEQHVVHRDIKCANILVDASRSVKLADFGLARITTMSGIKSSNGSPFWMAPEVVDTRKGGYGVAADIWSLGCTVLEMLIRKPPYHDMEPLQAMFKIGRGEPPEIPNSLSNDAKDFIPLCIQVDPNDRPTASQLLEHPFVNRPLSTPWGLPSHYHSVLS